jgi:hypothetical protein
MTNARSLTDKQAIAAAKFAILEWIKVAGPEALAIWQKIEIVSREKGPLDQWVLQPSVEDHQSADLSRKMLAAFLSSERRGPVDLHLFATKGIKAATEAQAHVFDPISAAVIGTLAIGLVLAARVKSVGSGGVTFYRGLPRGLSDIVKSVASSSVGVP